MEEYRDIRDLLEQTYEQLNFDSFVQQDPIQIPRSFDRKEDKEIVAFVACIFAWGQRPTIISKTKDLIKRMDNDPYKFIMGYSKDDLLGLKSFKHRTFNGDDAVFFIERLRSIYENKGLEHSFAGQNNKERIMHFRRMFFDELPINRSFKHISNPDKGSAAKRLNMFLRWMVRQDHIDLGLWKTIHPSSLYCPLDVHVARSARALGLLSRRQDDWKAVEELSAALRKLNPNDPIKYDLALFHLSESGLIQ